MPVRRSANHHGTSLAVILLLIALSWTGRTGAAEAPNTRSALGINLGGVTYWSSEIVFKDIFKHSQTWKSQAPGKGYGQGDPLDLDSNGWVRSLAGGGHYADSIILSPVNEAYPPGVYTCLYDGKGKIRFAYGTEVVESRPGRITVSVRRNQNILSLRIDEISADDPLKNIHFILPGFEDSHREQPFHPEFLSRWRRFSVLRFMDWQRTNNSRQEHWADRPTPGIQTQGTEAGVALEYMIELANTLDSDPWFCMPHLATDDYVGRFAQYVRRYLDDERKVYVEYSNECWNTIFGQARYCKEKGKALGLSDNDYQAQLRYYSKRSVEIFRIWEQVFGSTERLARVLAAQSANPWTSEQVLDFEDAFKYADVLGVAPYFGHALGSPKRQEEVVKMSVETVLDQCRQFVREGNATIAHQAELAKQRGLRLVAYEGGQHLVGHGGAENNQMLERLFHSVNRHPRMKQIYLDYLAGWKENGGTLMVMFSSMGRYSKWGSWGLMEYHGQPVSEAPKYQAVIEFLAANPRWW